MNPPFKEFTVGAASHESALSVPSSFTQSSQATPKTTQTNRHLPIPKIVITPFFNQLPPEENLPQYRPSKLNSIKEEPAAEQTSNDPQTAASTKGKSLLPSKMGDSMEDVQGEYQSPVGTKGGKSADAPPASPWLMEFRENVNTVPKGPATPVERNEKKQGASNQSYATSMSQQYLAQATQASGKSRPSLMVQMFTVLAARSYQEAVKIPETPPPVGWIPGQPIDLYYEELLMRFQDVFRKILEAQGCYDEGTFRIEWLQHCHNIMENMSNEWAIHPFGSTAGIKTTLPTKNAVAASLAISSAAEKPTVPPPSDWKVGQELHPYYMSMLARFERHLHPMIARNRLPVFQDQLKVREAINDYSMLIIREYRATWFEMFGQ